MVAEISTSIRCHPLRNSTMVTWLPRLVKWWQIPNRHTPPMMVNDFGKALMEIKRLLLIMLGSSLLNEGSSSGCDPVARQYSWLDLCFPGEMHGFTVRINFLPGSGWNGLLVVLLARNKYQHDAGSADRSLHAQFLRDFCVWLHWKSSQNKGQRPRHIFALFYHLYHFG